jgi:hypothetical protein
VWLQLWICVVFVCSGVVRMPRTLEAGTYALSLKNVVGCDECDKLNSRKILYVLFLRGK